jgi:hypothetical protein
MTSIHHTLESLSPPLGKRSPSKPPEKEPESANAKGKQKAIPETHASLPSELPFSLEINEGHLWPSTLPISLHLEKASWRHLNSIPNSAEGSAVAGGSGQNCQNNHKTPSNLRELPKPLSLREHQPETSMSRQLPKEENTNGNSAGVTKVMKQPKKLSNIRSQSTSKVTGCCSSLIQGLKNIIEPLTKLRKGKMTFRKTQKLVCAPEQPDNITSEKPGTAYPDLEKPPEIGAAVCTSDITPTTEDRRAQVEAIGSHSRKHPLEENPHKMTTQVDYNPQKDNRGAVRCDSMSEKYEEKHSPSMKSCDTSPLRRTDYRNKE